MTPESPGALRLEEGPEGVQVYLDGRPLLGSAPARSQRRRLPSSPATQTLYLVFSPLFGYGLDEFLQTLCRSSAILAVELHPLLTGIWHRRPTTPEALRFAPTPVEAVSVAEELVRIRGIRRVEVISLSGGTRLYRSDYARIETAVTERVEQFWRNRGTEIRLGRRWISNLWRNTAVASGHLNAPSGVGMPSGSDAPERAILLGAGPSLDGYIPVLEELSRAEPGRRPVVVALDTALPALADTTVPVDAVVAMDGQLANAADLVPWKWENAVLFADLTTHPSILRHFPVEHRFLFATRFGNVSFFGPFGVEPLGEITAGLPLLPPRGSVAPAGAALLASYLGFTSIVLAGIDFWYRPPRTHASMTGVHRRFLEGHSRVSGNDGDPRVMVRPWMDGTLRDGSTARSDAILASQAQHLAGAIRELQEDGAGIVVQTLPGTGLPIGAAELSREQFREWFRTANDDVSRFRDRLRRLGTNRDRRPALRAALERLRAQERILADPSRPLYLDSGLEFAWFDLPQWPLAGRSREWISLQRPRLLRAVRDHRRRLSRIVEDSTPQDSP